MAVRSAASPRPRPKASFDQAEAERCMRLALGEAHKGLGRTHPNPPVGAVLVKNGRVVGRGYHREAGLPHAEAEAIRQAGRRARGADLYVTLEPCAHFGRTPPCARAVVEAGVGRVFIGSIDPNPLVSGKGIAIVRNAGIAVRAGVLKAECDALVRGFARHVTTGRPWVVLKAAATLDGKIAAAGGDSKWVTGEAARALVHRWRDELDAILVGAGTVRADDPELTTRLARPAVKGREPRTPLRVILAGAGAIAPDARVLDASAGPVLVVVPQLDAERDLRLSSRGAQVVQVAGEDGRIDPRALLKELGRRGVTSLLVEGGGEVHAAFLRARVADEIRLFLAPRIVGADGVSWAGALGVRSMGASVGLADVEVSHVGDDLLLVGRPVWPAEG